MVDWKFIERHGRGARDAFLALDLSEEEFSFGVNGRPLAPVAIDRGCYDWAYAGCRCLRFVGGAWVKRASCKRA